MFFGWQRQFAGLASSSSISWGKRKIERGEGGGKKHGGRNELGKQTLGGPGMGGFRGANYKGKCLSLVSYNGGSKQGQLEL